MKLIDWLAQSVISDPRALAWFEEEGCEDRIVRAFKELLAGYSVDPSTILKTTRLLGDDERPGMVEVTDISFYSLCAHHFLPFFGTLDLCYEPGDRILLHGRVVGVCERRENFARELHGFLLAALELLEAPLERRSRTGLQARWDRAGQSWQSISDLGRGWGELNLKLATPVLC